MKKRVTTAALVALLSAPAFAATVPDAGFTAPGTSNAGAGVAFDSLSQSFVQENTGQLTSVGAYLSAADFNTGPLAGTIELSLASRTAGDPPSGWTTLSSITINTDDLGRGSGAFAWFDIDVSGLNLVNTAGALWGLTLGNANYTGGIVAWNEGLGADATYAGGNGFNDNSARTGDFSFRSSVDTSVTPVAAVPLPAALPLLLVGLGGLAALRRRTG